MKKLQLIISKQATHDLADIWLYVANDSPANADRFLDSILAQCQLFCASPKMGRARDELLPGLKSFPLKRYLIFYRVTSASVEIVRVLSGYRDIDSIF